MTTPGTLLAGRYRLVSRVGQGGMGVVYRAVDELLGRPVAVKVLRDQFAGDAEFVERFRREAQAAASLSHPNVVQVFDVGRDDGRPFIVMEMVDGKSLKEILQHRRRLPVPAAAAVALSVARALAHAHRHGLIHRDIKPHNILLTTEGLVKVADFGIARAASATSLTEAGTVLGSVHYFSPEQARGQTIGTASDIYSLGVVLYEMLAGRLPFTADTPIAVALQHLNEPPPPLREFCPEVPPALERCVMQALAKEPARRPASAEAFAEQIRRAEPRAEEFSLVELVAAGQEERKGGLKPPVPTASPDGAPAEPPVDAPGAEPAASESTRVVTRPDRAYPSGVAPGEGEPSVPVSSGASWRGRRRASLRWAFALAFLGGLMAAVVGFSDWLFPREVAVPNVVGRTEAEAKALLEQQGLAYAVDRRVYSSSVPAGYVISQDPEAGRQVREGRKVWATVSLGPEVGEVPDVLGKPLREARVLLTQQGYVLGSVQEGFAPDVDPNTVVAQDPPGGTRLEKGRPVNLVVSRGREPLASVVVPDFTGMKVQDVARELERLGLRMGTTWAEYSPQPPGTVIDQNPQPGMEVSQGDSVDLVYSQGEGPGGASAPPSSGAQERLQTGLPPAPPGAQAPAPVAGVPAPPGGIPAPQVASPRLPAGEKPGAASAPGGPGVLRPPESAASPAGSKWRTAEVTIQVPQGPDQEVVVLVIDDFGPTEALRRVVPGGSLLVEQVHGRGEAPRFQVYIDGRMVQEAPFPAGGP